MTDTQKAAMRQALDALTQLNGAFDPDDWCGEVSMLDKSQEGIDALRNALAEPVVEPVATQWLAEMIMSDCGCSTNNQRLVDRIVARIEQYDRANTSPPPPVEPVVGPVAYHYKYLNHIGEEVWSLHPPLLAQVLETQALYASPTPPANVPLLTDEDIGMQMSIAWGHTSIAPRQAPTFAREIEQAVRQKAGIK